MKMINEIFLIFFYTKKFDVFYTYITSQNRC